VPKQPPQCVVGAIRPGNARNVLNHANLAWPKASTSVQRSAPPMTVQMAMMIISRNSCTCACPFRGLVLPR